MKSTRARLSSVLGSTDASDQPKQSNGGLNGLAGELGKIQDASDIKDLCAALARAITRAIDADACFVSLWDRDRDVLVDVAASSAPGFELNSVAQEFSLRDYPVTRGVLEDGSPVEVSASDTGSDSAERELLKALGLSRVLISRLAVEGRGIGTVETYRTQDLPFGDSDPREVELLTAFASNAYARIKMSARLEAHYTATLETLVSALEARDPYTEAHAGRMRDLAVGLGEALHLSPDELRAVRLGAILHDVGKIGVSDAILGKQGSLTPEEWAIMRHHPAIGEKMLRGIDFLSDTLPIIRHHHEWWDGAGYPDGLSGTQIPFGARIVAVCDAFDAMTSDRPYRAARSTAEACGEMLRHAGTQFDPTCARVLVQALHEVGDKESFEDRFVRYAV